jgi:hypothetical protein
MVGISSQKTILYLQNIKLIWQQPPVPQDILDFSKALIQFPKTYLKTAKEATIALHTAVHDLAWKIIDCLSKLFKPNVCIVKLVFLM